MPENHRISEFFHHRGLQWQRKVVIVTRSRNPGRAKILLLCKRSNSDVPVMAHFFRIFHETVFSGMESAPHGRCSAAPELKSHRSYPDSGDFPGMYISGILSTSWHPDNPSEMLDVVSNSGAFTTLL